DIILENGKISQIIPASFSEYIANDKSSVVENSFDAMGRVITLPLINFHDHFYSRLAKGLPISGPTDNFENILKNLWWKLDMGLDSEMVKANVQMSIIEAIRNGVTTIFDHHASPVFTTGSLKIIADTLREYNLRGVLCFETSDRNGAEFTQLAIDENEQFLLDETDEDIKGMFGLHASFTLKDETLARVSEIIYNHNTGIHIHLCEDKADNRISKEKYHLSPVERLDKFNLMNAKSILSHGIHLNKDDYNKIAKYESAIALNLDSNLNNAVGVPDFSIFNESIPLLMGTDGMHDNIARSLKQTFLIHRHQGYGFEITFPWMEKIFNDQLSFAKKYFTDHPSLNEGDRADFIIYDYVPAAPFSQENFWGHYIYGILERPVHSVLQ
ncbi:MAG: amidohydrolase family protein, partial [Calditrichia bacterium]|nr:amidohydrolase family protein [Calditrichia bacterium]